MSVIDDLKTTISNYGKDFVSTKITDFKRLPDQGESTNVGDKVSFTITVQNNGELDLRNVRVQAIGTDYVYVGTSINGPFYKSGATLGPFNVDAGNSASFIFLGVAKKTCDSTNTTLVQSKIYTWDASFDHLLTDHEVPDVIDGFWKGEKIYPPA